MPVNTSELADTAFRTILDDQQLTYLAERFISRTFAVGATIVRTGQTSAPGARHPPRSRVALHGE